MSDKIFKRKQDYSIVAYYGPKKVYNLNYVHNIRRVVEHLQRKNIKWSVLNIYARRSGEFIKREYCKNGVVNVDHIEQYPRF